MMIIKKSYIIYLFLFFLFLALACGGNNKSSDSQNNDNQTTGIIKGKITDNQSNGVNGVAVFVEGNTALNSSTDTNGNFEIKNVPAGKKRIIAKTVSGAEGVQKSNIIVIAGNTVDIGVLTLAETGSMHGNVTLLGQTDNTGIDVYIPGTSFTAKTDAEGAFTIVYIPAGTYKIRAEKQGYVHQEIDNIEVESSKTTNINAISLLPISSPTGSLSGKAFIENQTDHKGIQINISNYFYTTTAIDGSYYFENIPEGRYTIKAEKNNYGTGIAKNVDVSHLGTYEVSDITLTPSEINVLINTDAVETNDTTIVLALTANNVGSGVTQMLISNQSDFRGAEWEDFSSEKTWTIPQGDGTKTVYVKFKDEFGIEGGPVSDEIILDTLPVTTANPPGLASGFDVDSTLVTLSSNWPGTIYYTFDTTLPVEKYTVYENPIWVHIPSTLKFYSVDILNHIESVKTEIYKNGKGNYVYVTANGIFLRIIDVSNPSDPKIIGSTLNSDYGGGDGVYVFGNYAYVVGYSSGLHIIDISNPLNPKTVGSADTPGYSLKVYVLKDYAFVADGSSGIQIIDISNPTNPYIISNYLADVNIENIYVFNNYMYFTYYESGLKIVDISNPLIPNTISSTASISNCSSIYLSGNYAYTSGGKGLEIVDISNPLSPNIISSTDVSFYGRYIYVLGNYAYIADAYNGLIIIDISNPLSPNIISSIDTPDCAEEVSVFGSYAYVADFNGGLQIIDISNPLSPIIVGSMTFPDGDVATGIFIKN